jgi:NAD(P)-dependent dehydrogenase (short-subunit alcohol dehydrogenase family)
VRWCEARIDQRDLAALRARSRDGARDLWPSGHPVRECGYSVIQADFGLGGGRIIVTSSTQGRHGTKYGAAYSASKWGIIGLMKSAVLELGEHNITVNAVIPGLIDTALTRHRQRYQQAVDDLESKQPTAILETEAKKRLIAKTPLGIPWIEPEAIAPAVVFLASDEAYMVSGATYDVTGGDSANYTA